jgi:monoamine oxidase
MEPTDELEIAIVGGGVAGLYAAWRLSETSICSPAAIAVFEAGEQVGGRLRSVKLPESEDLVAEAGGIAFHRTHAHVHRLVDCLGLATREHPVGSRRSLLNLRGTTRVFRKLRYRLVRPFPYGIPRPMQIRGVSALLCKAVERILPGSWDFGPEDWRRAAADATFMGRPLRDWPLHAALLQVLDAEEMRFLEAVSGYALFTRAPNAATGLAWNVADLAVGGSLTALVEGYQSFPLTLAQQTRERGTGVHLRHRLVAIDRLPDSFVLEFQTNGSQARRAVRARSVILGLPPRAMAAVPGVAGLVGGRVLKAVAPWPMCIVSLLYPSAWWASIGIERGRTLTDLPARQLWQFGRSESQPGLITSHSDGSDAAFWQAMASPADDDQGFRLIAPDSDIARELHRQVCGIYSPFLRRAIPPPQAGCFQDWGAPAYGGAVHVWARGVDPEAVLGTAMKPQPDQSLYLCGEAWSRDHGWVEGALSQTETMLQEHFGLQQPRWLS